MKEATGELNMTVVTVVAIAAVGAFFYAFVWPSIQTGLRKNTCQNICPGGTDKITAKKTDAGDYVCVCDGEEYTLEEEG